jgi:hypothetical protein
VYPSPVDFTRAPEGQGAVAVKWQTDRSPVGFIVFCSRVEIPPEATEAFYAGEYGRDVRRARLDADARVLVDERAPDFSWYLVVALEASGDLTAVPFDVVRGPEGLVSQNIAAVRVAGDEPHNTYRDLPELVYRDDDTKAAGASKMLALSLTARHGANE